MTARRVGCVRKRLILWRNIIGSMTGETKSSGGVKSDQLSASNQSNKLC